LDKFLRFTVATAHEHAHLKAAVANYTSLLQQIVYDQAQVIGELNNVGRPFAIQLGKQTDSSS
jgi:hypothetical protein